MIDFVTYSVIIDDLVFPDGRTAMAVLGGSGPQTAFGMKLWADKIGLVGGIGHDFPDAASRWFSELAIDTSGVRHYPHFASLRAWQIFEADGRRTQVWRTQGQAIPDQLALRYEDLPDSYRRASGFHYGVHPEHPNLSIAASLRANGVVVGIEPFKHADRRLGTVEADALVGAGQLFSPNLYEVDTMIGPAEPLVQTQRLIEQGAEVVALRLGADGSILRRGDTGETWHIPSYPTQVVDTCGAGNAYCGGLLVGWVQTGDLRMAGLYGAVSASFLVEQIGLPPARLDEQRTSARLRLAQLYPQTRRLDVH